MKTFLNRAMILAAVLFPLWSCGQNDVLPANPYTSSGAGASSVVAGLSSSSVSEPGMSITYTPVSDNALYSPTNYYAIWITDAQGAWVRNISVVVQPARAIYLDQWHAAYGSSITAGVDGVATASMLSFQPYAGSWDLKDNAGVRVPDGVYTVNFQYADDDWMGPYASVQVHIAGATPFDTLVNSFPYQQNIHLVYGSVSSSSSAVLTSSSDAVTSSAVATSSVGVTSSSTAVVISSSATAISSSAINLSSSLVPLSSSAVLISSSAPVVSSSAAKSSSSVALSSSAVVVSSSAIVVSSSAIKSSSSVAVSSSALVVSSSAIKSSSSVAVSSSAVVVSSSSAGLGTLTVKYLLKTYNGGQAPNHVQACWITTSANVWVTNLDVRAGVRYKNLTQWRTYYTKAISGTTPPVGVDGVSGATIKSYSSTAETHTWTTASSVPIAAGSYKLWIEFTEDNAFDLASKYTSQAFTIGTSAFSSTVSPSSYITAVSLAYVP